MKPGSTLVLGETDERAGTDLLPGGRRRGLGTRPRLRVRGERARRRRPAARPAHAAAHARADLPVAARRAPRRQRGVRAGRRRSVLRCNRSTRTSSRKRSVRCRCRAGSRSSDANRWSSSTVRTTPKARPRQRRRLRDDFMQEGRRIIVIGMLRPRDPLRDPRRARGRRRDPRHRLHAGLAARHPDRRGRRHAQSLGADAIEEPDVGRGRRPGPSAGRRRTTRSSSPARSTSSVRPEPTWLICVPRPRRPLLPLVRWLLPRSHLP